MEEIDMAIQITKSTTKRSRVPANELGFGCVFTDHMMIMEANDGKWDDASIIPFGNLSLNPASTVLHYGQEVFEGLKAYRTEDDRILLFRIQDNFNRMNIGAERVALPKVNVEDAIEAVCALVDIDRDWVPAEEGTSLYIRPNLFGMDSRLGVDAAHHVMLNVICSPSGPYYKNGLAPTKIYVEDHFVRAVRGGMGYIKTGGNYAASLAAGEIAHEKGFDQVLWLDGVEQRYVEEVGSMNIFFYFKDELVTPALQGSILSGITRSSVITLAESFGVPVHERQISIAEVFERANNGELMEVFGSGTAAVISPIGLLRYEEQEVVINNEQIGDLSRRLYDTLTGIQYGRLPDTFGWTTEVKVR